MWLELAGLFCVGIIFLGHVFEICDCMLLSLWLALYLCNLNYYLKKFILVDPFNSNAT